MKITLSAQFISPGRVGGVESMFYNLVRGFVNASTSINIICSNENKLEKKFLDYLKHKDDIEIIYSGYFRNRFIGEQISSIFCDVESDAIIFPNYFTPILACKCFGKKITVIHDFQYIHFPEYYAARKRLLYYHVILPLTFRLADKVVAVSQTTRDDAIRFFGKEAERKTVVIHNPVSWDRFGDGEGMRSPFDRPYVLITAHQNPHKNIATVIRAFVDLNRSIPDLLLILVGQRSDQMNIVFRDNTQELQTLCRDLGIEQAVKFVGHVGDVELGNLYRHATVFAYPSYYEGFGLPPVEALGFGIPTLTTRFPALTEVTMGYAQYVDDPLNISEWTEKLRAIIRSPDRYRPGADAVRHVRSQYDVETISRRYIDLIEDNA